MKAGALQQAQKGQVPARASRKAVRVSAAAEVPAGQCLTQSKLIRAFLQATRSLLIERGPVSDEKPPIATP